MTKQLSVIAKRWVEPTFWTYGYGSEVITSAFLEASVEVVLCCVTQRFTELVTMMA